MMKIAARMMIKLLQRILIRRNIFLRASKVTLPCWGVTLKKKNTILIMKMILLKLPLIKRRTRQALQTLSCQEIINNAEGIKNNNPTLNIVAKSIVCIVYIIILICTKKIIKKKSRTFKCRKCKHRWAHIELLQL